VIDGRAIEYTQESKLENLSWMSCDVVIEASGKFLSKADLEQHIIAGASKVILAAPSNGDEVKMVVLGVNDEIIDSQDTLLSNASCTTNSAAPMV